MDSGGLKQAHQRYVRRLSSGSRWDGVDAAEAEQRCSMVILMIESFFNTWVAADWQFRTDNPVDLLATTVLDLLRPALSDDAS